MVRLLGLGLGVCGVCACSSGSSGPKLAAVEPVVSNGTAPNAIDAGVPDAPELPRLTCQTGTSVMAAPAPEQTWFCARLDGTRDGPFITLYPDGAIAVSGSYKDGQLDGAWERRSPDGAVIEAGAYTNGKKDGHWRQASATGTQLGEYDLHAGTGVEKHWYDSGPLYSERGLKAGVPEGNAKIYGADGGVLIAAKYAAGKLDGPHAVGARQTMRLDETFDHGVRTGSRQIWQFWLMVIDETFDRHGRLDGAYTLWRSKKVPRVTGTYDHGKRTGLWTWTDRDNNKEREGNYVDGKRDGAWTEWYENKVTFTGTYVQGKPDGDFIYSDRNGNELGRCTLKDGTGTMLTFWANHKPASKQHLFQGAADGVYQELTNRGKVVIEGHYRGDVKHGSWKEWTADGAQLLLEETWKRGKLDGVVKKYVEGKLATESTYKDGKATGPYAEYRGGKPAVTGQFLDDRKTGTWTEYDADSSVVLTATYKDGILDGPWRQLVGGAVLEGTMVAGRRNGNWTRTERGGAVRRLTYQTP